MQRHAFIVGIAILFGIVDLLPAAPNLEITVASIRLDEAQNHATIHSQIEERVRKAANAGARFIVLPEYAFTGLPGKRTAADLHAQTVPGPSTEFLSRLARSLNVWIASGIVEQDGRSGFFSSTVLINSSGQIEQIHRKIIVRSGKEDGNATRGNFRAIQDTVDAQGIRVGIMPGDDIRIGVPRLAERGADLVFVTATWPASEANEWNELCQDLADEYKITIAVSGGNHATGRIYSAKRPAVHAKDFVTTARVSIQPPNWTPASTLGLPSTVPGRNFEPSGPELVEVGRKLFFDKNLSSTKTVACASCHQPDLAYTNGLQKGIGVYGRETKRNVPSLLNVAFRPVLQWDGYSTSIENFTKYPISSTSEMNFHYLDDVPKYVDSKPEYSDVLKRVFKVEKIEFAHVAKAFATYERTLISGNSAFDRYFYGGQKNALSLPAKRGLALFQGKAGCATCHTIGERHALFVDFKFHVLGIGYHAETDTFSDIGLAGISTADQQGLFQTPSLRDVAKTAPYMHDGSMSTLAEVIEFYNRGGVPNPQLDHAIKPLNLTGQEKNDLISFLESLTGEPSSVQSSKTQVAYGKK